jgi:hypothetical protein
MCAVPGRGSACGARDCNVQPPMRQRPDSRSGYRVLRPHPTRTVSTSAATPEPRATQLKTALLLLSVAAAMAFVYSGQLDRLALPRRQTIHDQIIAGNAPSPYRYRILVPFVAEGLEHLLAAVLSPEGAFRLAYAICDFTSLSLLLIALYIWLRDWFDADAARVGVLFVAATVPVALQDHYFQPWSLPETALFVFALIAMRSGRLGLLALLVAVASLNRETAVFIPLAFLITRVGDRRRGGGSRIDPRSIPVAVGLLAVWLVIFFGLRVVRGSAVPVLTVGELLRQNLRADSLRPLILNLTLFMGAIWGFAILGYQTAPPFVRQLAWIVPPYLLTIAVWGIWYEVRLLMPLYPILLPMALSFLYRDRQRFPGSA